MSKPFLTAAALMFASCVAVPALGVECRLAETLQQPAAWKELTFSDIPANSFMVGEDGIRIVSAKSASMLYADVSGTAFDTLSWTWSSQGELPPTDLRHKGGDDRRLAVSVAFDYRDPDESVFKKMMRGMLETVYGAGLPGRVISYTWASANAPGAVFDNPYSGADAKTQVIQVGESADPAMLTVMPNADYRRLFGTEAPPVSFIAVFSDTDDTGAKLNSRVSDLCLRD